MACALSTPVLSSSSLLLWRLGALGDTVLLLPTLAALRAAAPARRLVLAGRPAYCAPALWQGLVDDVIDAASPRLAALSSGAAPPLGALPVGLEGAIVWSQAHETIARGLRRAGLRHVVSAPPLPPSPFAVSTYYGQAAAPFGAAPVPYRLDPPLEAIQAVAEAWRTATTACGEGDGAVVLLHPGAGSPAKRWPLASFLTLARALRDVGFCCCWTLGPEDEMLAGALYAAGEGAAVLTPPDLAALVAIVQRAAVVVSADCGVAHVAALAGVPSVALFGPSDDRVWAPPSGKTTVLRLALPCAPCGEGMRACPTHICLRLLPVQAVFDAVRAHLNGGKMHVRGREYSGPADEPSWLRSSRSHSGAPVFQGALQPRRLDIVHTKGARR